jgi:hypothetical protein
MLNVQTMCSSIFGGKTTRLTVHYELEWSALFLLLITTLAGDVVSGMKWRWLREFPPSPQAFIMLVCYISGVFDFTAHHEEVGGFWHLYHQGMRSSHLFCYKGFLQNPFIKELVEIERICTSHVTSLRGAHTVHMRVWSPLPSGRFAYISHI